MGPRDPPGHEPSAGTAASCVGCGAALALEHRGRARCLYCGVEQPLPAGLTEPLEQSRALSERLDVLGRARSGRWTWLYWLVMAALILPGLYVTGSMSLGMVLHGKEPARQFFYAVFGLGSVGLFLAIPIGWLVLNRVALRRRLASLPTSVPLIRDDNLTSSCPRCGASHEDLGGGLTATCRHCGTEALLPLPLVSAKMSALHRKVFRLKRRHSAPEDATADAVQIWQRRVVPILLIGITVVFGGGLAIFFAMLPKR